VGTGWQSAPPGNPRASINPNCCESKRINLQGNKNEAFQESGVVLQ